MVLAYKDNSRSYLCWVKFLLIPFALIYSVIVIIRNILYDFRVLKSTEFDFPVVAVGNLRVGGTGKTPMIEYLIRMLQSKSRIGVLSRGYGRKTKGFILGDLESTPEQIGDEPLQIKSNFPSVLLAVDEQRYRGVSKLMQSGDNRPQVILLDDAMQHRKVSPGYIVMLTAFDKLFIDDFVLPVGRLREPRFSANRADVIVVTKCPSSLSLQDRYKVSRRIQSDSEKPVFFAHELYGAMKQVQNPNMELSAADLSDLSVVLFTGLSDASQLLKWVKTKAYNVEHLEFGDHHWFSVRDVESIKSRFEKVDNQKKIILTTQKDVKRISKLLQNEKFADLPIYCLMHEMSMFEEDQVPFEKIINDFIRSYSTNN